MTQGNGGLPYLHLIRCPDCLGSLKEEKDGLHCQGCSRPYLVRDGIPRLFSAHQAAPEKGNVTEPIRDFYEQHPFPNYDEFESLASLMDKARQSVFARLLDEQIPFGTRILECGCGTGQLSNFLGIAHRTVFGTDLSLTSLGLATQFRNEHQLDRVFFVQMNLFKPVFQDGTFDLVICNGVLHHTADPYGGFQRLARLVRPGGYLIVGLYHRYGRLSTDLRRFLFRISGDRFAFLDPQLRRYGADTAKHSAWFHDQYRNPHEVKYTIGEVSGWLPENDLKWIKSIPKTRLGSRFQADEALFEAEEGGGGLSRGMIELAQSFKGRGEGGFFTVIAQKSRRETPRDSEKP